MTLVAIQPAAMPRTTARAKWPRLHLIYFAVALFDLVAVLGGLTATVAHALRDPLGAVRTSGFILARKTRNLNLGLESHAERIGNGVRRCVVIISQFLDFARARSLQLRNVLVDDWLGGLVEHESRNLPTAVAMECHLNAADQIAAIDAARMNRVVINLINNAFEAMIGKGVGDAQMSVPDPKIVMCSEITARGVEVSVTGNGPGMSEDVQARIMEPQFTTKSFGTGLGLPAVQKILEQHGGELDLLSAPGQGAVFTAWWPASLSGREERMAA